MEGLLIIDMQNECFSSPRFDRSGTCERINRVSAHFRQKGKPVIFIQHDGTKEDYMFPGSDGFRIVPELIQDERDYKVIKTMNTSFYKTNLDQLLKSLNVETLYITGLATDFCVNATIHSALVKNYNIVVLKECHTTGDRPMLKAEKIIDFHNWLWAELTTDGNTIAVKSMDELEIL